jgi:hypothetical protein
MFLVYGICKWFQIVDEILYTATFTTFVTFKFISVTSNLGPVETGELRSSLNLNSFAFTFFKANERKETWVSNVKNKNDGCNFHE